MPTTSQQRQRFDVAHAEIAMDIESLGGNLTQLDVAREKLKMAVQEAGESDRMEIAWAELKAAGREAVLAGDRVALMAEAEALHEEAAAKMTSWRKESALKASATAIRMIEAGESLDAARAALRKALKERDEQANNVYRRNAAVRDLLRLTGGMLAVALLLLVLAAAYLTNLLGDWQGLLAAMLMGALGAIISVAISLVQSKPDERRLPEYAASAHITAVRPIFGAGFGVSVWLLAQAQIVTLFRGELTARLVAALLAGFSERWFLRILNGAVDEKEKEKK